MRRHSIPAFESTWTRMITKQTHAAPPSTIRSALTTTLVHPVPFGSSLMRSASLLVGGQPGLVINEVSLQHQNLGMVRARVPPRATGVAGPGRGDKFVVSDTHDNDGFIKVARRH
jgi:hypothetical protein